MLSRRTSTTPVPGRGVSSTKEAIRRESGEDPGPHEMSPSLQLNAGSQYGRRRTATDAKTRHVLARRIEPRRACWRETFSIDRLQRTHVRLDTVRQGCTMYDNYGTRLRLEDPLLISQTQRSTKTDSQVYSQQRFEARQSSADRGTDRVQDWGQPHGGQGRITLP